ncbi:holo-ACP synthase [Marinospirillum sp. MEB164]|uniref:Holo-[acyl-carrier-protein] synthase n=1 Tax=Marinospirillum alkalitolerans TaxID=3123374 RepID=A0ABW8PXT2_9GAMM
MILGIGTDLAKIARFEQLLARRGDAICQRLLTPAERQAMQKTAQPAAFLAKRFAAKEALLKALGTGLRDGLSWQQIEVSNDALGKPLLALSGVAEQKAQALGVKQIHLSLSDEQEMALAFVLLEGNSA